MVIFSIQYGFDFGSYYKKSETYGVICLAFFPSKSWIVPEFLGILLGKFWEHPKETLVSFNYTDNPRMFSEY